MLVFLFFEGEKRGDAGQAGSGARYRGGGPLFLPSLLWISRLSDSSFSGPLLTLLLIPVSRPFVAAMILVPFSCRSMMPFQDSDLFGRLPLWLSRALQPRRETVHKVNEVGSGPSGRGQVPIVLCAYVFL